MTLCECGTDVPTDANFCPSCGVMITSHWTPLRRRVWEDPRSLDEVEVELDAMERDKERAD